MRLTISLSLLAATIGLAACGSSSPNTGTGTTSGPTDSAAAHKQGIEFAQCVRSHGVPNFPDPGGNGSGGIEIQQSSRNGSGVSTKVNGTSVNGPAFQSAMQACRRYLPNGGVPTAAETAKARAAALAMSRCMRTHGVPDFPDPQFGKGPNGGLGIRLSGSGINPSSPAFQAAQKTCGGIFGFKTARPATAG